MNTTGTPYPEVTRVILPSSLMIVNSNAFVFSTCLLVAVFRYGIFNTQNNTLSESHYYY